MSRYEKCDFDPFGNGSNYLIGLWLGDGSRSYKRLKSGEIAYYPSFHTSELTILERVQSLIPGRKVTVHNGTYNLSLGPFKKIMEFRGLDVSKTARYKELPLVTEGDEIFLLSGLWDSDGHVSLPKYREARYVTTSRELNGGVKFLLRELGIESNSYKATAGYYMVIVKGDHLKRLANTLNLIGKKKLRLEVFR